MITPVSPERITLLCASYNTEPYLRQCFESVLAQTSNRWALLVVDDGSTDESETVYADYRDDPRITIISNECNLGIARTQTRLVQLAETEIVGVLDSDDSLEPTCVERVLEAYQGDPEAGFVYSNFWYCDESLTPVRPGFSRALPRGKTVLDVDCVGHFKTFRKSAFAKTDGYDLDISQAEDKDLVLKLEEVTKFRFVNESLYNYRVRAHSISHQDRLVPRRFYREVRRRTRQRRLKNGFPMSSTQAWLGRFESFWGMIRRTGKIRT